MEPDNTQRPSSPSPWDQPLPYQQPPTPITPPSISPAPTTPPPLPEKTLPPLSLPPLPTNRPAGLPMAVAAMMFVLVLISLGLAFSNTWLDLPRRTITVSGTGIAYSAPDVAKIDFGVRSEARNLSDSQRANADAIAKIKNDLAAFEIQPEDIQTINYNITPDYTYSAYQKPRLTGYTTYHFLRLTMRRLDTVDAILQTLGHAGITDISQIKFTIDDLAEIKSEARERAVVDAKGLADQLANLNGAKLGRIISIQEESSTDETPQPLYGIGGEGGGAGIEEGSLSVTSKVILIYSLR